VLVSSLSLGRKPFLVRTTSTSNPETLIPVEQSLQKSYRVLQHYDGVAALIWSAVGIVAQEPGHLRIRTGSQLRGY
jgi:hypothetical protein